MNFFGHAWLGAQHLEDPAFVLGTMLPDLAPMAGLHIASMDDGPLDVGRRFHVATDGAFHRAPDFVTLMAEGARALQAAGVRRGPARGAAHVGVELLLDGWISRAHGVPASFDAALRHGVALTHGVQFRCGSGSEKLMHVCARIRDSRLPQAYTDTAFTTARIRRALSRRPRLALTDTETASVAGWLECASVDLGRRAPSLLHDLARSIEMKPELATDD